MEARAPNPKITPSRSEKTFNRLYGGDLSFIIYIAGGIGLALMIIELYLRSWKPGFAQNWAYREIFFIMSVVLASLTLIPLFFEKIHRGVAAIVGDRLAKVAESQIREQLRAEVIGANIRESSMLMYVGESGVDKDYSSFGNLIGDLHTRTYPIKDRYAIAYCLAIFARESLGCLQIPMDVVQYGRILQEIMSKRLFATIKWTCPFSPIYILFKHSGETPEYWKNFAAYEAAATRVIYLNGTLFKYLLLSDVLSVKKSVADQVTESGQTFTELLAKHGEQNGSTWNYFRMTSGKDEIIIDVRRAICDFLNENKDTNLFFSNRENFESSRGGGVEGKVGLAPQSVRKERGRYFQKDYGVYYNENPNACIVIEWNGKNNMLEMISTKTLDYLKPFSTLADIIGIQSTLIAGYPEAERMSKKFIFDKIELIQLINQVGRKIENYRLGEGPPQIEVLEDQVGLEIVNHIVTGFVG